MKTGFDNRGIGKEGKEVKNPFSFKQPKQDDRSSCYVNAGTHWGVGKTQPVGHQGDAKLNVEALPFGRVNTVNIYHDGETTEII